MQKTTSAKDKQDKPSEPSHSLLCAIDCETLEPIGHSFTLENIPSWQSECKTTLGNEHNFFDMPMISDGSHLFVFSRQKRKGKYLVF
jgi:hypothetical protein